MGKRYLVPLYAILHKINQTCHILKTLFLCEISLQFAQCFPKLLVRYTIHHEDHKVTSIAPNNLINYVVNSTRHNDNLC